MVDIDASFSTQIDEWISAAEIYVNGYLGYTTASGLWNEAITTEKTDARVDGDLNLVIYPRKRPINSVSALSIVKGSTSTSLTLTKDDGTPRYIIPVQENVIVYPNYELVSTTVTSVFIRSFTDVKYSRFFTSLSYIAGYTSIPKDIKLATTLVAADYFMRQANKEGLTSITQGRITKRWQERRDGKSDFIYDAENILSSYKIASGWF